MSHLGVFVGCGEMIIDVDSHLFTPHFRLLACHIEKRGWNMLSLSRTFLCGTRLLYACLPKLRTDIFLPTALLAFEPIDDPLFTFSDPVPHCYDKV